ncbi:phosphoribosylglycinamide formyltransferase [Aliiglaciecola sp. CAU 1673]|uniref:phosphoribosylglycinamide formyltransferase n=1 Tax=Aliiglaciecola sp. CAU 1673 TaxID=3032595 RepID=UPI0023DA3D21|nr:phosphoribosylglycinamide formyltransferase [Aliiglaciecola sp. CAU 1673]MDF2177568.1 phosphoribosylglycinamide formyltransferase [Aliiglaciecola sp. CAU 1673]
MKSIVVLISGNGSNLQAILDAVASGQINGKVSAVISNSADAYGLERARAAEVPALVLNHKQFADRESYDQALMAKIDEYQPDLVVLAGFMRILTEDFVAHYQGRMLNIHPSLLPKFRGLHTHKRAIEAGETEHGATVHYVTAELDGGPIIIQSKVPVFEDDNEEDLTQRVRHQELSLYPLVVKWFCQDRLELREDGVYLDNERVPQQGHAAD